MTFPSRRRYQGLLHLLFSSVSHFLTQTPHIFKSSLITVLHLHTKHFNLVDYFLTQTPPYITHMCQTFSPHTHTHAHPCKHITYLLTDETEKKLPHFKYSLYKYRAHLYMYTLFIHPCPQPLVSITLHCFHLKPYRHTCVA